MFSVEQQTMYHVFAHQKGDVYSNGAFLLAAMYEEMVYENHWFSFWLILVALGSTVYHLAPCNFTLLLDRLPMALCQAELVFALVDDLTSIWCYMVCLSVVIYWYRTLDLLPYVALQGATLVFMVPVYPMAVLLYALAKVCELKDTDIFRATRHTCSGHTLKHILSALALIQCH